MRLKRSQQLKNLVAGLWSKKRWFTKFQKLGAWRYPESHYCSDSRAHERENTGPTLKTLEANGELNRNCYKAPNQVTTEQMTQPLLQWPNKRKSMALTEDKSYLFQSPLWVSSVLLHKMLSTRSNNKKHKIVRKCGPYENSKWKHTQRWPKLQNYWERTFKKLW